MLRATQVVLEERLAEPILIGRPEVIRERIKRFGLHDERRQGFRDHRSRAAIRAIATTSRPISRSPAARASRPTPRARVVRTNATVIGALALHRGEADALICGLEGRFASRLRHISDIVGLAPGVKDFAALSLVIARDRRSISSPTPTCATTPAPRRSPTWRSPAPITCAASA